MNIGAMSSRHRVFGRVLTFALAAPVVSAATGFAAPYSAPTTRPSTAPSRSTDPSVTGGPATTSAAPTTQATPVDERFAYAVGYAFGRRIRQQLEEQGRTADNGNILKGVIDGLGGHDSAYPPEQVQASVDQMHADSVQQDAERRYATDPGFRGKADDNARRSEQLLQQSASMAGVEVLPGAVQVLELKPGSGRIVGSAHLLTARYAIALADGTKVFETPGADPVKLQTGELLPALLDAIRNMKCGATWRVTLPPDKAYGLAGKPPMIGPDEALQIQFELVNAE